VSPAIYAQRLSVAQSSISRAVKRGEIARIGGLIDVERADAANGRKRGERTACRRDQANRLGRRGRALLSEDNADAMRKRRKAQRLQRALVRDKKQAETGALVDARSRLSRRRRVWCGGSCSPIWANFGARYFA